MPAGLVQVTLAVPCAVTVIVNVVPPRPATLPLHWTCVPMSVQVCVPTKWPLCADAMARLASAVTATTQATRYRRMASTFPSVVNNKL